MRCSMLLILLVCTLGHAEAEGEPDETGDAGKEGNLGGHQQREGGKLDVEEMEGETTSDLLFQQAGIHGRQGADGLGG